MEYDEETDCYYYPCPCGDRFQISKVNKDKQINSFYSSLKAENKSSLNSVLQKAKLEGTILLLKLKFIIY
jgi:hypothetical protein